MRLRVLRACSVLIASKPRAIAASGTRKPRNETKEGNGSFAVVNKVRKRNGSLPTVSRMVCVAA